jgi:nucleoside 2-deoxyribosyltransferase
LTADIQFQENKMKIYFSASVRGGRGDVEIYTEIIKLLKIYGEVITEYLGNKDLSDQGETELSDKKVYERDVEWIKSADVFVAEVTTPSLGVGYEISFAEKLGKRVLCIYREIPGKRLSNMVSGNKNLVVKIYKTIDDLPEIFKDFLN